MIRTMTRVAISVALLLLWATPSFAQQMGSAETALTSTKFDPPPSGERLLVFISDIHLGLGKQDDGTWSATEDFRWDSALQGFLEHISEKGNHEVDLVVLGDFLELWQPPANVVCTGPDEPGVRWRPLSYG